MKGENDRNSPAGAQQQFTSREAVKETAVPTENGKPKTKLPSPPERGRGAGGEGEKHPGVPPPDTGIRVIQTRKKFLMAALKTDQSPLTCCCSHQTNRMRFLPVVL